MTSIEKVNIDGINAQYTLDGDGAETVLLLHGWGCNAGVYEKLRLHLAEKYRVLTPDFPGFGGSDEPKVVWGVDEYADFTEKLCQKLGVSPTIIFAHSFGGRVSLKLMARKNCSLKIRKAVLTGAAGIKPKKSFSQKLSLAGYKVGKRIVTLPPIKTIFPNALDNMRKKRGSSDYNACSEIMRGCFVKIVNEDLRGLLTEFSPETLLVWGSKDDAVPLDDARLMEKEMPNAGLAVMEDCGHYCFLQQPDWFNRIIDNFI